MRESEVMESRCWGGREVLRRRRLSMDVRAKLLVL